MSLHPIGVFDSGMGGLTVAHAIVDRLPQASLLYFGDTAHIPYGTKSADLVLQYSENISQFLIESGCKVIVVACNTASAAALPQLRARWPEIPFIGMEPAVKPGAKATRSGLVGVLATAGTFKSQRYASLMARYAKGVAMVENPCLGLVEQIEAGQLDTPATEALLRSILEPMMEAGADTFVLGCTHYPFVAPLIRSIIGPDRALIDPAPAVARQLERVLRERGLLPDADAVPVHRFFVSGPAAPAQYLAQHIMGVGTTVAVRKL